MYGVQRYQDWKIEHPDPTIEELVARFQEVAEGVRRRREQGKAYPAGWLFELGLVDFCAGEPSLSYYGLRDWEIPTNDSKK